MSYSFLVHYEAPKKYTKYIINQYWESEKNRKIKRNIVTANYSIFSLDSHYSDASKKKNKLIPNKLLIIFGECWTTRLPSF